ncbi:MAG: hypothetical protein C0485_04940 [Pirellula sp.]|nr:hypothetical protein [Pirellula sp.]
MSLLFAALSASFALAGDEFEQPPIEYARSTPDNRVSQFQADLARNSAMLPRDPKFGYLPAILKGLDVDADSQMLVFSKTSMQRDRISPRSPRAIYFNDDVYVGYCHRGEVIEIAAADPQLGAVFYTLNQQDDSSPELARQTHSCLQCHGATQTDDIPGFLVRSLFVAPSGLPILSEGSHRVDHTTPIEKRWGGWYVSGTHGVQTHLGNLIVRDQDAPRPWKNVDGLNVVDLGDRFATKQYLTPHSDIVALLAFEHQTFVHNLITKANFTARQALYYQAGLNRALGKPEDERLESTTRRIENAGEKLVQGLLMCHEAPLAGPVVGSSGFAERFSQLGPRDRQGRSLRDLDLKTRLLKYPCSYLIYSPPFDGLPPVMKEFVARRLQQVLAGQGGAPYAHLSATDRAAIAEIIRETKPDLLAAQPVEPATAP